METAQQRTVEQVIDVPAEEPRKEFDPLPRSVEQVVDVPGDEGPSASLPCGMEGGPLNVTRRVAAKAAPYERSIAGAVPLELERVRYEKRSSTTISACTGTVATSSATVNQLAHDADVDCVGCIWKDESLPMRVVEVPVVRSSVCT